MIDSGTWADAVLPDAVLDFGALDRAVQETWPDAVLTTVYHKTTLEAAASIVVYGFAERRCRWMAWLDGDGQVRGPRGTWVANQPAPDHVISTDVRAGSVTLATHVALSQRLLELSERGQHVWPLTPLRGYRTFFLPSQILNGGLTWVTAVKEPTPCPI